MNKKAQLETSGGRGLDSTNVEDLLVPLEHMSADSLNFWLCKFICEVAKESGERYPPKTLYLLLCGINRHFGTVQGETEVKRHSLKQYVHMSIMLFILISRDLYQKLMITY